MFVGFVAFVCWLDLVVLDSLIFFVGACVAVGVVVVVVVVVVVGGVVVAVVVVVVVVSDVGFLGVDCDL